MKVMTIIIIVLIALTVLFFAGGAAFGACGQSNNMNTAGLTLKFNGYSNTQKHCLDETAQKENSQSDNSENVITSAVEDTVTNLISHNDVVFGALHTVMPEKYNWMCKDCGWANRQEHPSCQYCNATRPDMN